MRYDLLKSLFNNKLTVGQAEKAIEEANHIFVRNSDEINGLKSSINLANMLGEEVAITKTNAKPVKDVLKRIANLAQICVKP